jgi:hypothetical protein
MRFIDHARAVALALVALMASAAAAHAAHTCPAAATTPAAQPHPGTFEGRLLVIGPGGGQITVGVPLKTGCETIPLADAASQDLLQHAKPGEEMVKYEVDDVTTPTKITKIDEVSAWVPKWPRVLTFFIAGLILAGVATLVTWFKPLQLVVGKDGRYSNSQVQLALWFGAVAWVYISAVWLRFDWLGSDFIGGVGLTNNLIALTGLSALTFGGAKVITMRKVTDAGDASPPISSPPASPPSGPKSGGEPNLLTDLFTNDTGDADLGDVQMILITVAAVLIFLASSFHFLGKLTLSTSVTLPDVDTALLAGFGIGQGAYLFKKAALPLGQG